MKYSANNLGQPTPHRGMTLVELMIALALSVVVLTASTRFLIEGTRSTLRVQSNTQNDLTDWGISAGITIDTRTANGMTLYKDFSPTSFDTLSDRITDTPQAATNQATRGDFLVLSQTTQENNSTIASFISLTGYVYTAGAKAGTGTFKKFTYAVPDLEKNDSLETILTTHYSAFNFLNIASGLDAIQSDNATTSPKPRAFQYRSSKFRSGVLNLQVTSGFQNVGTGNNKLIETAFYIRK